MTFEQRPKGSEYGDKSVKRKHMVQRPLGRSMLVKFNEQPEGQYGWGSVNKERNGREIRFLINDGEVNK